MSSLLMDEGGVSRGKSYECKFCGMAFSDGRVLGGHVRSHMAAAGLTRRSKKLGNALGECSEGDGGGRSRGERGGYGLRENRKKSWKFSGMGEERRECSPRGKNQCGVCERGFRTSRALIGHMRLHSKKERRVRRDRGEMGYSDTEASLEEIGPVYEKICQTKRKKRSVRARNDENLPGHDLFLPAFLGSGIQRDEFEAAICLLMISRGVRHLELSDVVNKVWENSSPLVNTEDEGDDSEASDGFDLGVSNKKRRVSDVVNAAFELREVPGRLGSFSTCSNAEGKLMKYEISHHMVSQGINVQSLQTGDIVEEIKHLVGEDSADVRKVPELTIRDELGRECEKKLLPDSYTGKCLVPTKKEGYKCKDCGKIFAIHQALGGHRAKFKNGSCQTTEKSENNVVYGKDSPSPHAEEVVQMASVTEAVFREPDHKCPTCGEVFSSGQALGGHKRRHYKKGSSAVASKRSADASGATDVSSPLEVFS